MATIEKLLQVKLAHPHNIFEFHTDTLNAARPDLQLFLNRDRRMIEVKSTATQHAGKTVEIPFEAILNICIITQEVTKK